MGVSINKYKLLNLQTMTKRKIIITAAMAATAAASSMLGTYPVSAQNHPETTFSKAADILGLNRQKLIDAFKKARIELIEDNIKNGNIDPKTGIEMIHKIEDSEDFLLLPKLG